MAAKKRASGIQRSPSVEELRLAFYAVDNMQIFSTSSEATKARQKIVFGLHYDDLSDAPAAFKEYTTALNHLGELSTDASLSDGAVELLYVLHERIGRHSRSLGATVRQARRAQTAAAPKAGKKGMPLLLCVREASWKVELCILELGRNA